MVRIISKEEEREDIQGEILQSIFEYSGVSTFLQVVFPQDNPFEYSEFYSVSTGNPATPSNSTYRINSSTRILQEILQTTRLIPCRSLQGIFQQLLPMHPSILHGRIQAPKAPLQHSRAIQHKQASSNSRWQKQHSTAAASIHAVPTIAPRRIPTRILPRETGFFPKGLSIVYPIQY